VLDEVLQTSMIDGVEERLDVCVEHPVDLSANRLGERIERIVRRSARPKTVREPDEFCLQDRLQHPPRRLLDDLVFQRWDAERSRFPIAFRDEHTPHRLRMVTATMNSVLQIE
jgi:hypothetical protein